MTHPYKWLAVAEAMSGMKLSDDVLDQRGHVLLTQGTTLTDALLDSLRRHGIGELAVAADEEEAADQQAERSGQEARLAVLFRYPADAADANSVLEQYVRRYRLGEAA